VPGESGPLKLEKLHDILGKEDASVKDTLPGEPDSFGLPTKIPITWYCYDWCWFGVYDTSGHVLTVRAECKAIRPTPADQNERKGDVQDN
jgi:hypothetical protein